MGKNLLKSSLAIVLAISFSQTSFAAFSDSKLQGMSLDQIADKALLSALETQIKIADQNYLVGEFPTQIQSTLVPALVGVGKAFGKNQEATAFTTASVINMLSETYLENKDLVNSFESLRLIPNAIKNGVGSFERYAEGSTFNFYPPHFEDGQKMRRPIDMTLFPIWHGFTNIPNDADTTSAVLASLAYNSKINKVSYKVSAEALDQMSLYRDIGRNPQYYNRIYKRKNTGAFMTWLYHEKNPEMPQFYFASAKKGERIPFNKNDVDCVVNANVLKLAALEKKTSMVGVKESCAMLNEMIKEDEHASCGIYYPNTFNLSFAMASAEKAGDKCLTDDSKKLLVNKILSLQDGYNGFWLNDKNVWEDKVLSTAFALSALLEFADPYDERVYPALVYGTHFLLSEIQYKKDPIKWPADHFFTATAIARSLIMWQSEAYTNVIISQVLFKMHRLFPQFKAENYLKIDFK